MYFSQFYHRHVNPNAVPIFLTGKTFNPVGKHSSSSFWGAKTISTFKDIVKDRGEGKR